MKKTVQILETHREFDGFFKLDRIKLRHRRYDSTMSQELERLVLERGDAVAVLLYDPRNETLLLIEQFRYPTYARGDDGWLIEIVAGTHPLEEDPEATARKELGEETGLCVERLEHVTTFYPSPGGSTERVHLYIGYLDQSQRVGPGGGVPQEHEDIRLIPLGLTEATNMLANGELRDGKTIMALQHLLLKRANLI